MGWYYTLIVECKLLPEYVDYIRNEYMFDYDCYDRYYKKRGIYLNEDESIPVKYRELLINWINTDIGCHWSEYKLKDETTFIFQLSKKVYRHVGDLWEEYLRFMRNVIVPITSNISKCIIESDDYGDRVEYYTDEELRYDAVRNSILQKNYCEHCSHCNPSAK